MTASALGPETLAAIEEIRQLAYRYAYAQDFRDRELLLSLWAETEEPAASPEIDVHTVRADLGRSLHEMRQSEPRPVGRQVADEDRQCGQAAQRVESADACSPHELSPVLASPQMRETTSMA